MLKKFIPKRIETLGVEILLREAQKKDLKALNRIVNEPEVNKFICFQAPVRMETTSGHYLEKKRAGEPWIVVIFQGKVAGSIDLKPKSGRESHVSDFGVAFSKEVHGKGIAEASVRCFFAWLARNGIKKIVSSVISDNERARAFYKKLGFGELCLLSRNCKRGKRYLDTIVIEKFL